VAGVEESDYREMCREGERHAGGAPAADDAAAQSPSDLVDTQSPEVDSASGGAGGMGNGQRRFRAVGDALKTGFATALKGTVAGLASVARVGTNVVTLGGTLPLPASGLFLGAGVVASGGVPRGYLMVFDAVAGRQVASRRIQGSVVNPTTLAKPHSAATALTFSPDGGTLFLACCRGMLHAYEVETDAEKLAAAPLLDHRVIYGEEAAGALVGGLRSLGKLGANAFDDLAANFGLESDDRSGAAASADAGKPYFSRLFYKRDVALGAPVLVTLDSLQRIRAFTVPAATAAAGLEGAGGDDEVARAAAIGIGATVKASLAIASGAVALSTLGAVQVKATPQAAELTGFVSYLAPVPRGTGVHTICSPLHQSDGIVAAAGWGEAFLLAPHGVPVDVAARDARSAASEAAAAAAIGSCVAASMVRARFSGHAPREISAVAVSPDDAFIVTADTGGRVQLWTYESA
jgi:hypothetical protein